MTATINTVTPRGDGQGNIQFIVDVTFSDATTSFSLTKQYSFPTSTTQAAVVATITADGNVYKTALATISNLASKVGAVITI